MRERSGGVGLRLGEVRRSLERWRRERGGRGRPIPTDLWNAAAAVARIVGVDETARTLRLDRARLASHVERGGKKMDDRTAMVGPFVEIDAGGICAPAQTVVRMEGRDGERLEITLSATSVVDVAALARAFWTRSR